MSPSSKLELLAEELKKEDPKVVVVVGAGVSIGATSKLQASWQGLLEHGVEYAVEKGKLTEDFAEELKGRLNEAFSSPFDLDEALRQARFVKESLDIDDSDDFADWLEAAFGNFTIRPGQGKTLAAIENLIQAGALVLTTNYDNLLTDQTGLPPVTWKDPDKFLQVTNRELSRILHVHGHWRAQNSVVLGKESYNEIVEDEKLQKAFEKLWLETSWVFVGCGNGLEDPNFRSLMRWRETWEGSAPSDYFLAKADEARALEESSEKPSGLVSVGYSDHGELPGILNSLTPSARLEHFNPVDEELAHFRSPSSSERIPSPSWQEYLDGKVPCSEEDEKVQRRLSQYGWAFIVGKASVGKTTLALRVAAEERDRRAFYLDVSKAAFEDEVARGRAVTEMRQLSRMGSLLILDNVHHRLGYVRNELWSSWQGNYPDSRVLLVATRTERVVVTDPAQDLNFFEDHDENPAIDPQPTPKYLSRVMQHLYNRFAHSTDAPEPPPDQLKKWYQKYKSALSAFCLAVLERLSALNQNDWELPFSAAADWVRKQWLDELDAQNYENLLSIAVFSAPEVELQVPQEVLPHPNNLGQLLELGLVTRTERGQFNQYRRFSLRDPSWGRLILSAQASSVDEEKIMGETAVQDPLLAVALITRLKEHGRNQKPVWDAIEHNLDQFSEAIWETPLSYVANFFIVARQHDRITNRLWKDIERQPGRFAESAWKTSLDYVAYFLSTARKQSYDVEPLWEAIEDDPERLAERAWQTPLDEVAHFLKTAQAHGRETEDLWEAIEDDPERLVERAWQTPLDEVAHFLKTAQDHGREVEPLWEAIEDDLERLAERAWQTPLEKLAHFLKTAQDHGREVEPLWEAIEDDPERLAERAWETPLGDVASFLEAAQVHDRETEEMWDAIEDDPERLAKRAWETPLEKLAYFLETARRHDREVESLWDVIEDDPERFARRVLNTPLEHVPRFFKEAQEQDRETESLWEAIGGQPDELSMAAKESSMDALAAFFRRAPTSVIETALSDFPADHWDEVPSSEPLVGGTRVASACVEAGREDLKSALVTKILQQANQQDFPNINTALKNIGWLLKNISSSDRALIPDFLDEFCERRWLRKNYMNARCDSLASGLRMLVLHQSPHIYQRFLHLSLDTRLEHELLYFNHKPKILQSNIIQLFGCAALCGRDIPVRWLRRVSLRQVGKLPVDVLSHRPDASNVEHYQFQLWLGLRTVVWVTRESIEVPTDVIDRTLNLWKNNLENTSQKSESAEHNVNRSMVEWLDKCSQENQGLLPSPPPDWPQ